MMQRKYTIDLFTLGCSKNLVDSEKLIRQLELQGFDVNHDPACSTGDVAIVNTCGFIGDAKEESIHMILELGKRKQDGSLKRLYVMGCLSERYLRELNEEIPEVDHFYGKFDWNGILEQLGVAFQPQHANERRITTPSHYAYLKISEGCNRHCSYCAIPIITGRHVSRPMEDILEEVRRLVAQGVKEFQVIAQELTYYGMDLYKERRIAQLVEAMADIPGVEWIRLHYAYPVDFPMDLLRVMREKKNVCKYMDVALQHIANPVLDAMHRHINREQTYDFITELRRQVPGIHLRTTLMVGHPGETEEGFNQLIEFVKWARFERMGAFAYSEEEGTYSAEHYTDDIPEEVKQVRLSKLMRVQQAISTDVQQQKVGQRMRVIVDRLEGDYFVGRTEFDSPEVDPEVLIAYDEDHPLQVGTFYEVHIDSSDEFDLYGHVVAPETNM